MTIYRRNPHLAWRIICDQAYIVDPRTSTLHELNELGTFIWNLIDSDKTLDKIAANIIRYFEVSEEKAKEDTEEFLNALKINGLVETV